MYVSTCICTSTWYRFVFGCCVAPCTEACPRAEEVEAIEPGEQAEENDGTRVVCDSYRTEENCKYTNNVDQYRYDVGSWL